MVRAAQSQAMVGDVTAKGPQAGRQVSIHLLNNGLFWCESPYQNAVHLNVHGLTPFALNTEPSRF
jgi:hypothetical protein